MKGVTCTRYGPPEVLQIVEVPKPRPREVRPMIGLTRPRKAIVGIVLAGEIEATGREIPRFSVGDRVYGLTGFSLGTYAEWTCLREADSMRGCPSRMPRNLGFEAATAAAHGGLFARQCLEKGRAFDVDALIRVVR